jgi:hypothetical protein
VSLNVPARGTIIDGLFIVALEDVELAADQQIRLDLGVGEDRRSATVFFARTDPCTGE